MRGPPRRGWRRYGIPALACLVSVAAGWTLALHMQRPTAQQGLVEAVIATIQSHAVNPPDADSLRSVAVDAVLDATGDPYTRLLGPSEYADFRRDTEGAYVGVGIEVEVRKDTLTVVSTVPGSPASAAGLKAGDQIVAVDGQPTTGWTRREAALRFRGEEGTGTSIDLARAPAHRVRLERSVVHTDPVSSALMLDPGVGYIELTGFPSRAAERMRGSIKELESQGMEHLVVDLRDNPGGLLKSAFEVASLFLPEGSRIATLHGPGLFGEVDYHTETPPAFAQLPLTLLIGPGTASAAEIVAAALRDHDRAQLVGGPTYGKGAVQSLVPLDNDHLLKLTTGLWVSPDGLALDHQIAGQQLEPHWRVLTGRAPGEELLFLNLGDQWESFRSILRGLALDVADQRLASIDRAWTVLPGRLQADDVVLPRPILEAAEPWVRSRLAYDLARYQGHPTRARSSLLQVDPVVVEAIRRAQRGGTR